MTEGANTVVIQDMPFVIGGLQTFVLLYRVYVVIPTLMGFT